MLSAVIAILPYSQLCLQLFILYLFLRISRLLVFSTIRALCWVFIIYDVYTDTEISLMLFQSP